jgi:type IV pilus assembly protein PilW
MRASFSPPTRARGFTLVELLVALVIALALLDGLFLIFQGTRQSSSNVTALSQLQNNERIAMTMLTDVIQQAGYYVDVQTGTLEDAFPPSPVDRVTQTPSFAQPGQFLVGRAEATPRGDSITIRYQTDSTGTILNCLGQSNHGPVSSHADTFSVNSSGQLVCSVDGATPVPLVGNIENLQISYGVNADSTDPHSATAPTAYVGASDMTAVNWTNVRSVRIALTFTNPLLGQPGQSEAPPITSVRTVGVMSRTGVNVITSI